MIIHWSPCYDDKSISWSQPEPNKLVIEHRGKTIAVDFSNPEIVEYEPKYPVHDYVCKAWREGGVLNLNMPCYGRLAKPITKDHGEDEVLTWR